MPLDMNFKTKNHLSDKERIALLQAGDGKKNYVAFLNKEYFPGDQVVQLKDALEELKKKKFTLDVFNLVVK